MVTTLRCACVVLIALCACCLSEAMSYNNLYDSSLGLHELPYSLRDKDMIVGYIAKQKEHHRSKAFAKEYREFLTDNGVEIKEEYFLKD